MEDCREWFLSSLSIIFLILWFTKLASYLFKKAEEDEPFVFFVIGGWVLAGLSLVLVVCGSLELIQLVVAPKVWLIEYAAHLVKGAK